MWSIVDREKLITLTKKTGFFLLTDCEKNKLSFGYLSKIDHINLINCDDTKQLPLYNEIDTKY